MGPVLRRASLMVRPILHSAYQVKLENVCRLIPRSEPERALPTPSQEAIHCQVWSTAGDDREQVNMGKKAVSSAERLHMRI